MITLAAYQQATLDKFLSLIPANSTAILEVGSDVQYAVVDHLSASFNGEIVGINPTPGFVKRDPSEGPPNVTILEVDGCNQPFEADTFDAILSIATLEHVGNVPEFLAECWRVLKPGGVFYTSFGPIFSSGIGHHVCAFAGKKEARFWKPGHNIVPDFAHLLWDEEQMRNYFLTSPYDDRLIDPIIHWIYRSKDINRSLYEDYVHAFYESKLRVVEFNPSVYKTPPKELQELLDQKFGSVREFSYHLIEAVCVKEPESAAAPSCERDNSGSLSKSDAQAKINVVLNFHKNDQHSASSLLALLLAVDEGVEATYHLQYGDRPDTLEILDVLNRFLSEKDAVISFDLPDFKVPDELVNSDPNTMSYAGNHAVRTKEQKKAILQWNLCIYKYLHKLDHFLMLEPDCVILKHGWLDDIFKEYFKHDYPIFGHLKKGVIGNRAVPTHWAGCSVYNSRKLRDLPLEYYFSHRFENPWWKHRNKPGTENANNAFYGPVFSGYDVSYDYFLFALYWATATGSNDPLAWPSESFADRSDLIYCDFKSTLAPSEIVGRFAHKLPFMHGVKDDAIRHKMKEILSLPRRPSREELLAVSKSRMAAFQDIHRGKRCVIIGNGPSLNKMDLSFLEGEICFGMNRIFLIFDQWKFRPAYYVSVNPLVIEQSADDILALQMPKFLSHKGIKFFDAPHDLMFIDEHNKWTFAKDPYAGMHEGWTVTFVAMQLAFFMGFSEVVLIGVDHHFVTPGDPNKEVVSQGDDPNHFHPDYFGKGMRWHLPDLERSEHSYHMAKEAFESSGRRIVDATLDGKLTIFPKVDYREYFSGQVSSSQLQHEVSEKEILSLMEHFIGHPTETVGIKLINALRSKNLHNEADEVQQAVVSLRSGG